jgi:hypothetical protein
MKVGDIVRFGESVKAKLSNRQTRYQKEIDNRRGMIMTWPVHVLALTLTQ